MSEQEQLTVFNRIYDETYRSVLKYVTTKCHHPADIQDILQETYGELFGVLISKGCGYIREPEAFVFRLAKTKISRHYRKTGKWKDTMVFSEMEETGWEAEQNLARDWAQANEISDLVADRLLLRQISDYLKQKPSETQRIFYLYYVLDLTLSQTADALNLKESTVKNRLYRTSAEIRKLFSKVGEPQ